MSPNNVAGRRPARLADSSEQRLWGRVEGRRLYAVESYTLHTSDVQECGVMSPNSVSSGATRIEATTTADDNRMQRYTHSTVEQMDVGFSEEASGEGRKNDTARG